VLGFTKLGQVLGTLVLLGLELVHLLLCGSERLTDRGI
jgi:hypothetical protein